MRARHRAVSEPHKLTNILLNELDKELERRAHPFVRYADDVLILRTSRCAAVRIKGSITRYLEGKQKLKANSEKTECPTSANLEFLGYSF